MTLITEPRPRLHLPSSKLERVLNGLSLIVVFASIVYFAAEWTRLPSTVAIHFNGKGEPDGWGSKGILLILPLISLLLYIGVSKLVKYPHLFNYLQPITEANAPAQYLNARQMMNWLKFEIIASIGYSEWIVIQAGHHQALPEWDIWFTSSLVAVFLGTLLFYILRSFKLT